MNNDYTPMTIKDLRNFLDQAIKNGEDPDTPICACDPEGFRSDLIFKNVFIEVDEEFDPEEGKKLCYIIGGSY